MIIKNIIIAKLISQTTINIAKPIEEYVLTTGNDPHKNNTAAKIKHLE